jgi:hypothetical protein
VGECLCEAGATLAPSRLTNSDTPTPLRGIARWFLKCLLEAATSDSNPLNPITPTLCFARHSEVAECVLGLDPSLDPKTPNPKNVQLEPCALHGILMWLNACWGWSLAWISNPKP